MFSTILSWLGGGILRDTIREVGGQLTRAYELRLKAETDSEKLKAETEINRLLQQQAVLVAEQGSWMTRPIRPIWAAPFIIYTWVVVVGEKLLGWVSVTPLSAEMWWAYTAIAGAYFLVRPFEKK